MLAPSSVMTRPNQSQAAVIVFTQNCRLGLHKSKLIGKFSAEATSWAQLAALISSASVVEVEKILATFDRQSTSALLHVLIQ